MISRQLNASLFLLCLLATMAGCGSTIHFSEHRTQKQFAKNGIHLRFSTINIDDHLLHFAIAGQDTLPTLLFIHGSPGSWSDFTRYLKDKDLLKKFRLIAIDRPGFGGSDYGYDASLNQQSALIGPLMDALQNGMPWHLVGHSYGGPLALKIAADYPRQVAGVVSLAGIFDANDEREPLWIYLVAHSSLQYIMPGKLRPSNKELLELKDDLEDLQSDLTKVLCPVFLMQGNKDNIVNVKNATYAKQHLINAASTRVIILKGANHHFPWTRYKTVKTVLLSLK